MPGSCLSLRDLCFAYGGRKVLDRVGIEVRGGELVALLGANGAGKSTLLRLALGLLRPASGQVLLDGRPLSSLPRRAVARHLAYVPQSHVCPFPYCVREVVTMGRLGRTGMWKSPGEADHVEVEAAMERLGIAALADRPYTQVSGGERQLALLCRALVQGARLLVLDEPASSLDFGHQIRLMEHLMTLTRDGYGVLMSTHHPDHALMAASRAVLLKDGRVLADGPPAACLDAGALSRLYGVPLSGLDLFHRAAGDGRASGAAPGATP